MVAITGYRSIMWLKYMSVFSVSGYPYALLIVGVALVVVGIVLILLAIIIVIVIWWRGKCAISNCILDIAIRL